MAPWQQQEWISASATAEAGVDAKAFPLQARVLAYRHLLREREKGFRAEDTQALQRDLLAVIAGGADPNAADTLGRTMLGLLVCDTLYEAFDTEQVAAIPDLLKTLMRAGANPLLADGALSMALPHRGRGFAMGHAMLEEAVALEAQGLGVRDAEGGTAVHFLVNEIPYKFYTLIKEAKTLPEFPKHWWTECDAMGQQPLHRLWSAGGQLEHLISQNPDTQAWEAWNLMAALLARGGNLLVEDDQGITPADGVLRALDRNLRADSNTRTLGVDLRRVRDAMLEEKRLEQDTPRAGGIARRPGRI